jgi:nicotinate-nucleotide adenylyltransferase
MRTAFFGGSFDPPHRGHLAIARAAAQRLSLDRVWMAPAGTQPLKLDAGATSYTDRLAMVELAVAGEPRISASSVDAPRTDGRPNYTMDVLLDLKRGLRTGDELFFLLGADAFLSLKQWHRASELPMVCGLIVAGRPGFSMDDVASALPDGVRATQKEDSAPGVLTWELRNDAGQRSSLDWMPDLHEDISATDIRAAIAGDPSGRPSGEGVLAAPVLRYIKAKGLYH